MNSICAATFISNTDNYNYPINIWKDQLYEFDGIHIKEYPKNHIKNPSDIADCQNETLKEVSKMGYDYCLFVQADIFFDKLKSQRIYDLTERETDLCFKIDDIKLFHYLYSSHFGISLFKCKIGNYFVGDGAYLKRYDVISDHVYGCSMGYLNEKLFNAHKMQNSKIWKQGLKDFGEIKSYKRRFKIKYRGLYKSMIDSLGLYKEYVDFKEL